MSLNLNVLGQLRGAIKTIDDVLARCVEDGGCWIWRGGMRGKSGVYKRATPIARYGDDAKVMTVTKIIALLEGRDGDRTWRTCESSNCVNPKHLRTGPFKELGDWMKASGKGKSAAKRAITTARNERRSKLSERDVEMIRGSDLSNIEIADRLRVDHRIVSRVRLGQSRRGHAASVFGWRPGERA